MMTWQTTSSLLPHQEPPAAKLRRSRVGGLFMEMGTGKTRVAIEFAKLRQGRIDKVIWFCPVSLKETTRQEIIKHTDSRSIYVFDEHTRPRNLPKADWYIIGIESMSSSDRVVLTANQLITTRSFIVLDESSYIKGHASLRTRRITRLSERARYRLILTGTPMTQGVVDLFAQMRFLSPKILGYNSFYSFAANHLEYSPKYKGLIVRAHNTGYLAAKIAPYVYQVTKEEAGLDLPAKLYDTWYFRMTGEQMRAYQRAKEEILLSVLDEDIDSYVIFQLFTALQQIVSGFWNRRCPDTGKVELWEFDCDRVFTLRDGIARILESEKVIIWCKYRYSIQRAIDMLSGQYGPDSIAQFHGGLSESERNGQVERFRREARFFVASQQAGGHGLTLNEAAYSIFYEDEFKYANRLQAEGRNHRIGQCRRPTYPSVVCSGSIDERIQKSRSEKGSLIDDFQRKVEQVKGKKSKGQALKEMVKAL